MKSVILSENPRIEFILGDCMDYMDTLPDKAFELAIVDPPYGIGIGQQNVRYDGKKYKTIKAARSKFTVKWDGKYPDKVYFDKLLNISKNQIIWGANHFISQVPFDSSCWLVWDKNNGTTNFADCELAWTSFKSSVRKFSYTWNGMLQEDMKNKETRIHPTQKPVALYDWILSKYAKKGDRILDTHGGSFSSAIACYYAGHDFVGIELDEDYFNQAVERFKKETRQKTLADFLD